MTDTDYMRRALRLAANGRGLTRSNPMVGAVIAAPDGRIIGEGWHRRYGEAHAEVNAVASVAPADRHLLSESTIYVTLEPCSHYGKTPPCANLLRDCRFRRVVVAAGDPNPKVNGRGIAILREAGIEVDAGLLAIESERLNRVFFTAQRERRPFVTLKWARSADGFMDIARAPGEPAYRFSTPLTTLSTMRLRAENQAVISTAVTVEADNARLSVRQWEGGLDQPLRIVIPHGDRQPWGERLAALFADGVTSVLVEAGPTFLGHILDTGIWDAIRVETSPDILGEAGRKPAPGVPPRAVPVADLRIGPNRLAWYSGNPLFTPGDPLETGPGSV